MPTATEASDSPVSGPAVAAPSARNRSVRVAEDVLFRAVDGEAVLLAMRTGRYYGLSGTAAQIWSLLANRCQSSDIVAALIAEYDAPSEQLAQDVIAFIEDLESRGLVEVE